MFRLILSLNNFKKKKCNNNYYLSNKNHLHIDFIFYFVLIFVFSSICNIIFRAVHQFLDEYTSAEYIRRWFQKVQQNTVCIFKRCLKHKVIPTKRTLQAATEREVHKYPMKLFSDFQFYYLALSAEPGVEWTQL